MVDNVAITAGTGTTIGADDIAGVLIQRVKTTWGPDGTANDADVATGKPLPVQLRSPTGTDLTGTAGVASAAVITVQGIASGTTIPVTGTITAVTAITNALPAGTNEIGKLAAGVAQIGKIKVTTDAGVVVDPVAAGSAAMAASVPVTIATDDTQFAALLAKFAPQTSGGLSIFRSIDLDEGACEVVKASAGQLYACWVTNTSTATRFVKIYDAASGTIGTGTPVITVGVPGNASDDIAGHLTGGGHGIAFATGICMGASTGVLDNDTGAPGANDVIVNVFYK